MKIQTRLERLTWRMRSGAMGFCVESCHRALESIARTTPRSTTLRPRARGSRMLFLSLVAVPMELLAAEYAREARNGSLLPEAGVAVSEAASLRGSLDRYYHGDELLNGREIAL